jgi:hypothetical protein
MRDAGSSKKKTQGTKKGKKARGRLLFAALALGQQPTAWQALPSKYPIPASLLIYLLLIPPAQ